MTKFETPEKEPGVWGPEAAPCSRGTGGAEATL